MITLITGVPGAGKTAHVVEMLLKELKKERKIYSLGIPQLLANHKVPDSSQPDGFKYFACENAGNPCTWQKGTWLGIDSYSPKELSSDEFDDEDEDDGSSNWKSNGNGCTDKGALIIIDECQTYFRPRSSSAKVPNYIAAFEVHRHQGVDFWLLTQKPHLIDGNLRGLVNRHIHIHTSGMGKKRLEWAEAQDPKSKASRMNANITKYVPNPKVFDLYKSATTHTKLKVRMPNGVYVLGALGIVFLATIFYLYSSLSSKMVPIPVAQASEGSGYSFGESPPKLLAEGVSESLEVSPSLDDSPEEDFSHIFEVTGFMLKGKTCMVLLRASFGDLTRDFRLDDLKYNKRFNSCYYQGKRLKTGLHVSLDYDDYLIKPDLKPDRSAAMRATRAAQSSVQRL